MLQRLLSEQCRDKFSTSMKNLTWFISHNAVWDAEAMNANSRYLGPVLPVIRWTKLYEDTKLLLLTNKLAWLVGAASFKFAHEAYRPISCHFFERQLKNTFYRLIWKGLSKPGFLPHMTSVSDRAYDDKLITKLSLKIWLINCKNKQWMHFIKWSLVLT